MQVGSKIGRYQVRGKIGEGGMGEVYLADDIGLGRKVALKILSSQVAGDNDRLRRFEQEAKAASALNHPNILTVYEFSEVDGIYYLATEFVEGRTLRSVISAHEFDFRTTLKVAEQTAFALDAAHTAGIVHRDIKPENIMLRADGIVKVLDFGLAKLLDRVEIHPEDETRQLLTTAAGHIVGTATYMSPEQARGRSDLDARTDIWSLGVVIYEMCARKPPFTGETVSDLIASVLKSEAVPLLEVTDEFPAELDRIVTKALKKDREERYQVIKDLALDIRSIRKQIEYSVEFGRPVRTASGIAETQTTGAVVNESRRGGRLWTGFAIGSVLLLCLIGIVALKYFDQSRLGGATLDVALLKTTEVINWASQPGEVYAAGAFSPDGKMVAFSSTRSGSKQLWIKQVAAGEAVQVTQGEFIGDNPIWSPNGDELAFLSDRGGKAGFWRTPTLGGSPRLIANVDDGAAILCHWSKDGAIYFESNSALFAVNADGGEIRKLADLGSAEFGVRSIDISDDNQRAAYVTNEGQRWNLWVRDINRPDALSILSSETEIRNLIWHSDNQRILFSSPLNSTFQIFVTDLSGAEPKQISFSERDSFALDVSPDGSKVLFGSAKEESDIWGVGIDDGKEFTVASDIDAELWPNVSPDGQTIIFQATKGLSQGNNLFSSRIVSKSPRGTESPVEIVKEGSIPIFSPNGQWIAFVKLSGNKYTIATTRVTGGEMGKVSASEIVSPSYSLLPYLRVQVSDFSWSPDSDRLAFVSRRNGQHNIWMAASDGSPETQVTENADAKLYFHSPMWSADGKRLAFTSRTADAAGKSTYSVWIADVQTREIKRVSDRDESVRLLGWNAESNGLFLATTAFQETGTSYTNVAVNRLSLGNGAVQEIRNLADAYPKNTFLSANKKFVAYTAHREGRDNVWILPLAGGAERKLTSNNDARLYFSSLALSPNNDAIYYGKQSRYSILSTITNFK